MSEPLISIVMPLRNAATTLAETLDSIQSQTLQNIEVIMIDDFSEDDTRLIAEALCNSDRRFRCIKATNRGLVPALNQGIREAQSPLIARMDGDDIMLPSRLEKQWELLEQQPSVGVVSCGVRSFSDGEIGEGYRLYDSWLNSLVSHEAIYKARYIESPLAHPTAVVRRSILESMGGYRDMGWPEDYDLWLRLWSRALGFRKCPKSCYTGETNPSGPRGSTQHIGLSRFSIVKLHISSKGRLGMSQVSRFGEPDIGEGVLANA